MHAKDKLNPPTPSKDEGRAILPAIQLEMPAPKVTIGAPQITLNPKVTVQVAAPQVHVDITPIRQSIEQLGALMASLAQQQGSILTAVQVQNELISKLVGVKVEPPVVNIPARPRAFSVEFEKDAEGATIGMFIEADRMN